MSHTQDCHQNNNNHNQSTITNNNELLSTPSIVLTHHSHQQHYDQQLPSVPTATAIQTTINTSTSTNNLHLLNSTSTTSTTASQIDNDQHSIIINNNSSSQYSQPILSSSMSRLDSSTTSTTSTSLQHDTNSIIQSWSMQYINGQIIPPIIPSTTPHEDCIQSYSTQCTHQDYRPFWYLQISFFLMFTAYSLVLNLLTTVYGSSTALALAILYVFFVLSALIMPAINSSVFNNNTTIIMFYGSLGYSFMMLCSIFGSFPLLLIASIIVGSLSSCVWVSYGSVISSMARHIAEQAFLRDITDRLHKCFNTTIQRKDMNVDIKVKNLVQQLQLSNGRINLSKITDVQLQRIVLTTTETISWLTSVGWMLNSTSAVVGAFISWLMLTYFKTDDPITSAQRLFILFFCFGVMANIFYYITYRNTPISMFASNEQLLQINQSDEISVNDHVDIVDEIDQKGDVIFHSQNDMINDENDDEDDIEEQIQHQQHGYNNQQLESNQSPTSSSTSTQTTTSTPTSTQTTTSTQTPKSSPINTTNPIQTLQRSFYMMKLMLQQRTIILSMITFFQTFLPIGLTVSFFTANAVRPTLGLHNVPLIIMVIFGIDSITAFILSRVMKGFHAGRYVGIIGSLLQLLFIILILLLPSNEWINPNEPTNLSRAWYYSLLIGVISGIGDGCFQTGHNSSLGILAEGNPTVKSAAFSLSQAFKSMGSITVFLTGRIVTFKTQCIIVLIIVIISIGVQIVNIIIHIPLDIDYLMRQYDEFIIIQQDVDKIMVGDSNSINNINECHSDTYPDENIPNVNKTSLYHQGDGTTIDELGSSDT